MQLPTANKTKTYRIATPGPLYRKATQGGPGLGNYGRMPSWVTSAAKTVMNPLVAFGPAALPITAAKNLIAPSGSTHTAVPDAGARAKAELEFQNRVSRLRDLVIEADNLRASNDPAYIAKQGGKIRQAKNAAMNYPSADIAQKSEMSAVASNVDQALDRAAAHASAMTSAAGQNIALQQQQINEQLQNPTTGGGVGASGAMPGWLPIVGIAAAGLLAFKAIKG